MRYPPPRSNLEGLPLREKKEAEPIYTGSSMKGVGGHPLPVLLSPGRSCVPPSPALPLLIHVS